MAVAPATSEAIAGAPADGPAVPGDATGPYPVVDVVDGDTLKVERDGKRVTIRVIGLDTPETRDPRRPVQCFGREASARAHALLDGQSVKLSNDPTQDAVDKYGRTLAYVWLADGRLFQYLMITDGYGHEYTYDIPYRYQDTFKAAERSAREQSRGLWSPQSCNGDTGQAESADASAGSGPASEPAPVAPVPAGPVTTAAPPPTAAAPTTPAPAPPSSASASAKCDPNYTGACVPPYPPDVDCPQIGVKNFRSIGSDPHKLDGDHDGIACES